MSDDIGTLRWFGRTWNAPVCDPRAHIPTPIGKRCDQCDELIVDGDQGVTLPFGQHSRAAYHLDCWLEALGVPTRTQLIMHVQNMPGEYHEPPC